jgi:holliday junction DNA helicase RuvA
MLGRIRGTLIEKNPPQVLVEVGGIGYELDVPMSTFFNLPELGASVTLTTHFIVREDAQLLYGFLTQGERSAFRQLLKVSGVGPKVAMAVLSGLSVDELARTVSLQDATRLTRVPGVGKKTAERLILELKDKLAPALPGAGAGVTPAHQDQSDALNALLALGYSDKEASLALRGLAPGLTVSDTIRQALKALAKG